jgi:hypothetical protein
MVFEIEADNIAGKRTYKLVKHAGRDGYSAFILYFGTYPAAYSDLQIGGRQLQLGLVGGQQHILSYG